MKMRSVAKAVDRLGATRSLVAMGCATVITASVATFMLIDGNGAESPPKDSAFLDTAQTSDLISSATTMVDTVFSVDPGRPRVLRKALTSHLTDNAAEQFKSLYASYLDDSTQGVTVRTSTLGVGVVSQSEDMADVLVVARQEATADDGRSNSGIAQLRLQLAKDDTGWWIDSIDVS